MKRSKTFEPKKKLRIIVLVHQDLVPPDSLDGLSDKEKAEIKTEFETGACGSSTTMSCSRSAGASTGASCVT